MEKFFYPRSLAVFGASATKTSLANIVLLNNLQNGYQGKLYAVGSREGELSGIKIYKSVRDLPETPDVAIFLTPAATIPALLQDCGEKGITHIVIESGGFSEYSQGGKTLEEEVLRIAERYGMKIIGPNCVGTINFDIKMMMPFGFFSNIPQKAGKVALIVQSGGVGGTFLRSFAGYGVTPGKFVAIGNKLQLDETHFLEYLLSDPQTEIITAYLEGFKRGREFFNLAMQSEKPIIVLKSNRSEASQKIAQSHTTALSVSDDVTEAAFKQAAIIRVEDEINLINAVKIIGLPPMRGRRVAVLSRSGGHAVLTADACAKLGFEMVPFPESFLKKLKTIYHTKVIAHQNPLDLGEIFDYTIFTHILEEALKLDCFDGVLFNHLYIAQYEAEMSHTFLQGVEKLVAKYQKPVALAMISEREEILAVSKSYSFPIFTSPLEAADALHTSFSYHEQKKLRDGRGKEPAYKINRKSIARTESISRAQKRILLTNEALDICAACGIKPVKSQVMRGAKLGEKISLRYPVALKLLSRDASHKTDIGGVRLNIQNRKDLLKAHAEMRKSLSRLKPRPTLDGFLIQEMAEKGIEFFVGGRRDALFGPLVMAGVGGIFIEIFKDTSIRLAPVTKNEAIDMLQGLKAYPLLKGARGAKSADIKALADIICRASFLLNTNNNIAEVDLNPVIVHPQGEGVSIVDARIFLKKPD
ncbi:MAG TPA: acetate--CoA ligase family protein [Smithellaceae bacterium]|nr:acetate--CoA ligase family protein [Smithellaceae bacterium]HRS89380.1 acetate--CoA ligase family protein [Smithellaceae bacterium]HRV26585.1 acetate--CoA ligase family protein [Smithellaceae bacterium]